MNIREIAKPITSATLNESMAQKFGTKIDLQKFNFVQLEDARNKLRSQVRDIETNESFNAVHTERLDGRHSRNAVRVNVRTSRCY